MIAGILAMQQRVAKAEQIRDQALAEIAELRTKYGYIDVQDDSKTYLARIDNSEGDDTYRLIVPAGSRYLIHISDTAMQDSTIPDELPRTKTYSMNGWRDGADVILKWGVWGGEEKRFVLSTHTDQLFDYKLKDWDDSQGPNEGFDIQTDPQKEFDIDEKIILSYFGNEQLQRGIVLWIEPHSQWQAWHEKQNAKE